MTFNLIVTEQMQTAFINGSDAECSLIAETMANIFKLNKNEVYMFLVNLWAYVAAQKVENETKQLDTEI